MYNKQQWEDLKIYSSKTHTDHPPPEIPWRSLETNQVSAHAAAAAADLIYPYHFLMSSLAYQNHPSIRRVHRDQKDLKLKITILNLYQHLKIFITKTNEKKN